jgi:hypothetical protein
MAKREVFHSSPSADGWKVTNDGETISNHRTQVAAEKAATAAGQKAWRDGGLGQAVLHKKDGTIAEERTYGKDPWRTLG